MTIDDLEERLAEVIAAPTSPTGETLPLVGKTELEAGSPVPYRGRTDARYKDLDTQDPLYVPRFLVREWGWTVFALSAYHRLWEAEASKKNGGPDLLPSQKKKVK